MAKASPENDLSFLAFSSADKSAWIAAARQELKGEDPLQKLGFQQADVEVLPYYDGTDRHADFLFHLPAATVPFRGARSWLNIPCISVSEIDLANQQALLTLREGADGILFNMAQHTSGHIETLLHNIDMNHCSISFAFDKNLTHLLEELRTYDQKLEAGDYGGVITLSDAPSFDPATFAEWNYFRTLSISVDSDNGAQALTKAFQHLLACAQQVDEKHKEKFFKSVVWSTGVGNNFFATVATMKALHVLWFNVLKAFQVKEDTPPIIHATSTVWTQESKPHSNMIKATTAALSAVVGGCSWLTVMPEDEQDAMMVRIARNVSNILRDESHMSKVADPTAGSYYVDYLTKQIAEQVWNKITRV